MEPKTLSPASGRLYKEDFLAWTEETARLLRAGCLDYLDVEHLTEEIESMGRSEWHGLDSRLTVLLLHVLKWKHQPRRRSRSWESTILTQRLELRRLLRRSPMLRAGLEQAISEVYPDAVKAARVETRLPAGVFPPRSPFTPEQVLDEDFLPG